MNPGWAGRSRRAGRAVGFAAAWLVIALAVLIALAQLLLPLLASRPQWIAAQLSQRLHRPVSIGSIQGQWTWTGPRYVLRNVSFGAVRGGAPIQVPEAELGLDLGAWLLPTRHLLNLRVSGLTLTITHAADGRWQVDGLGQSGGRQQSFSLDHLSLGLVLDRLTIRVLDQARDRRYVLLADQLRLGLGSGTVRFGARLRRQGSGSVLRAAGVFRTDGRSGRVWLGGSMLDVGSLLADVPVAGFVAEHGTGELAAWLTWRGRHLVRGIVSADLAGLVLAGPGQRPVRVARLQGLLDLAATGDGYRLGWSGRDGSALAVVVHQPDTGQARLAARARNLQLAPLLPWLALAPALPPALADWIGQGRPRGLLTDAALRWSRAGGIESVAVDFRQLGIDPAGALPGVDHLRGELLGDAQSVVLTLSAQGATVRDPHALREPLALDSLNGTLALWREHGAWQLGIDPLQLAGSGFAAGVRGTVTLPAAGATPVLNLYARIAHLDMLAVRRLLPVHAVSPATSKWLDRALLGGRIDDGAALFHGALADWPFAQHQGRFEAQATIDHLSLDYGQDWPRVADTRLQLSFVNNSIEARAEGGHADGVKIDHAAASIADLSEPVVKIDADVHGSAQTLLDFARTSPVARSDEDMLSKLRLGGPAAVHFQLTLPLDHPDALTLAGGVQLTGDDVAAPVWQLQLDQLTGPLTFDAHGLAAGPLQGFFRGEPVTLQLDVAEATGDPAVPLRARLQGRFSLAELVQNQPAIQWLGPAASGKAPFTVDFALSQPVRGGPTTQRLQVDSSLAGIALHLPAPLDKRADAAQPLRVTVPLPTRDGDVEVALGQSLRGRFRLPTGTAPLAASVRLGGEPPGPLPPAGLRVAGHVPRLDVSGWVQRSVGGAANGSGPTLESIDVSTDHALLFGTDFPHMRIQVQPLPDGLHVEADSATLAGSFVVPNDLAKGGITARMQRLYWPRAAGKTGAGQTTAPEGDAAPPAHPEATGIDPKSLPPLHLVIDDLRLGDARLGQARLETWATLKGMHIDQLRALAPSVQITASGDWNGSASDSHTRMRIDFSARSLGALLATLGYGGVITGGQTTARLDARWPGAPSSISLGDMQGKLAVDVVNGRIPEVAPGVGRLFGLVSLAELPRRLGLDFGDVLGKGLGFDSIKGNFTLADGNAVTHNLIMRGPAVQVAITGRTGLRARDYDQQLLVTPHIGNGLPVVGAVVAGPIGAAAGLAVQGLLGRGINKAVSVRYTITGSWKHPVMTLVEKHGAPVPAAPAPAASSTAPAPAGSASRP